MIEWRSAQSGYSIGFLGDRLDLHKGTKCEIGIARNACLGAVESTASEVTEEPVTRPVPVGHRNP